MDVPLLSVVVPTRNEAGNVEKLVERLAAVLRGVPAEIIFVDDSTDETPAVVAAMAQRATDQLQVRLLHREPAEQTGLGSAAAEGLHLAAGRLVAVMDGDLQHPPELLATMVETLERDRLDLVVASRYSAGGSSRGLSGPARMFVSRASKLVAQLLFREARKTSDPLSGFFLGRRSAIDGLVFRPIGFKILLEVLVCANGAAVGDVPLTFAARHAGSSNASVAQGVAFLRHLWSLLVHVPGSARRLKFAAVGAAGMAMFLGLLELAHAFGVGPHVAWGVAFVVSLFLNWQLNRLVTFADVASPFTAGRGRPIYLPAALVGGAANLAVFTALLSLHFDLLPAAIGGVATAMVLNYLVHRGILARSPRAAADSSRPRHAIVDRIAELVDAEVNLALPPADELALASLAVGGGEHPPKELLRAVQTRKPLLMAEAPSHKAQARTDVGVSAWMAIPVLEAEHFIGLLVLHRSGNPFSGDEMDSVLRALRSDSRDEGQLIGPMLASRETASG